MRSEFRHWEVQIEIRDDGWRGHLASWLMEAALRFITFVAGSDRLHDWAKDKEVR